MKVIWGIRYVVRNPFCYRRKKRRVGYSAPLEISGEKHNVKQMIESEDD
jgi:hypothetical protein